MKLRAAVSCGLLVLSCGAVADHDTPENNPWNASIFASYIDADSNRLLHTVGEGKDDGAGIGGALGYRFNPNWEARLIFQNWDLESDGDAFGVDALYHFSKHHFYAIGGIKHEDIGFDDGELLNFGLGKRFELTNQLFFTAEALLTQSIDNSSYNDFIANLGLTYTFGSRKAKPPAKPAPAPVARLDSDNDGVYDDEDACPNTPMTDAVDSQGCSRYKMEDENITLSINFASNDDRGAQKYYSEIKQVAEFMAKYPDSTVVIEGHTSSRGGAAYNQNLSERRAKNVAAILVERFGVGQSRVSHVGYGEERLLDTANTNEAHRKNRRIEARISGSKRVKIRR